MFPFADARWIGVRGAAVVLLLLEAWVAGCNKPPESTRNAAEPAKATTAAASAPTTQAAAKVTVYYFHRTLRCESCLAIERMAEQVVRRQFGDGLASGELAWRAVNIERPENAHFENEFDLQVQSLILVRSDSATKPASKRLEKVWDLFDQPEEFARYVATELREFLGN